MSVREFYAAMLMKFPPDQREKPVRKYKKEFFDEEEQEIINEMLARNAERREQNGNE